MDIFGKGFYCLFGFLETIDIFALPKNSEDMPKQKTNSGAKKRFKVTGSGKIKRNKAFKRHLLGSKSKSRKEELSKQTIVHKSDEARVKKLLVMI